jgi:DNA-binding NtrC family response regulator
MEASAEDSLSGLSILIVDDEAMLRRRLAAHLEALGADVTGVGTLEDAQRLLVNMEFDFILLDIHLPDGLGTDLLREGLAQKGPGVVVMTAEADIKGAVEAMHLGALDYLVKPFEPGLLPLVMRRARRARQSSRLAEHALKTETQAGLFFGASLAPLREELEKILAADRRLQTRLPPVLIIGETGTGKSSLARWLHCQGPRATQPMIEINCSALPESLAESELFGHERGAFTDARAMRQGLFEAAHGGTLFLDELPSLPSALQAKVLTTLEDRKIRRLGGNRQIEVDVRIIAATSRDLRAAVESGDFREDLLHRLDLYRVRLPPLRERGQDILSLAEHLLSQLCKQHRLPQRQVTEPGKQRLLAYGWPGNIRELAHELERGLVFEAQGALDFAHLPNAGQRTPPSAPGDWLKPGFVLPEQGFILDDAINRLVQLALKQSGGNISQAARRLGVTRDFVRYRLHGDRKEHVDGNSADQGPQ